MVGVMLGLSAVPTLLFTVHDHVRPISGNGCRGEGLRGSPPCQRAPCVPQARQKYAKGVEHSRAYIAGVGRGKNCSRQHTGVGRFDDIMGARVRRKLSPEAPISSETFPQGSDGTEVGFRLGATDTPSAPLAGQFYRGPTTRLLVIV
jgi:hypothetical protein